jgi:hypothetical protein
VTNPYVGLPGFWNRWNRITYSFSGAAQVGVGRGRTEAAYVPPADPSCPICGSPMAAHTIDRGTATVPTRVHCPS